MPLRKKNDARALLATVGDICLRVARYVKHQDCTSEISKTDVFLKNMGVKKDQYEGNLKNLFGNCIYLWKTVLEHIKNAVHRDKLSTKLSDNINIINKARENEKRESEKLIKSLEDKISLLTETDLMMRRKYTTIERSKTRLRDVNNDTDKKMSESVACAHALKESLDTSHLQTSSRSDVNTRAHSTTLHNYSPSPETPSDSPDDQYPSDFESEDSDNNDESPSRHSSTSQHRHVSEAQIMKTSVQKKVVPLQTPRKK